MNVYYDENHVKHRPLKEFDNGTLIENADKPERVVEIRNRLSSEGFNVRKAYNFSESYLYLVHEIKYVKWLENKARSIEEKEYFPEVFGYDRIFDTGTPITRECYNAAIGSVNVALSGVEDLLSSERVAIALCRPPGHHASASMGGGYCYFNNAALAARYLQSKHNCRVAILDLDFHHGNGTQEIFYEDHTVLYTSIHGAPEVYYPWISGKKDEIGLNKGMGYNFNYPLPGKTAGGKYLETLSVALNEVIRYRPEFLFLSLGLDTHKDDPVGDFNLIDDDYHSIGKLIRAIDIPLLIIQEGGYNSKTNPRAFLQFLKGVIR